MDSTSVSLLRRLCEPDHDAAWQRFVDLYAPLIFHWARNQGLNATDAADLVQEVLVTLVAKLPEFEYDPTKRFRGWLRTVTLGKIRDSQRRGAVRSMSGQDPNLEAAVDAGDADLFEQAEYQTFVVNRALELMRAEFNDKTWQACWMQIAEGQKAADVAQRLGISLNMAYLAKSRVLRLLRDELDGLLE